MVKGNNDELKVGIYWCVDSVIVGEAVSLSEAEPYGDALQHGSHYEFWESLSPENDAERKLKAHAYDAYPRGRMVYFPSQKSARLYVDKCLNTHDIANVLTFFGIGRHAIDIHFDEHYRCAGCNPQYLDI